MLKPVFLTPEESQVWVNTTISISVSGVVFLLFYTVIYLTKGLHWWPFCLGAAILIFSPVLAIPCTMYRIHKIRKRPPKNDEDIEANKNKKYAPVSGDDPDGTSPAKSAAPTASSEADATSPQDSLLRWALNTMSNFFSAFT